MGILWEDLYDRNFGFSFKATAYSCVAAGIRAYEEFLVNSRKFLSYPKGQALRGRLLTCAVEKSFYLSTFKPSAQFGANVGKLNDFGYNGLYLKTDDFIINIARTDKPGRMPQASKYRRKLAKSNSNIAVQLQLDMSTCKVTSFDFRYALLTYGYYADRLTHLNILVPSADYGWITHSESLMDICIAGQSPLLSMQEPDEEEQVATLKDELRKELGDVNGYREGKNNSF